MQIPAVADDLCRHYTAAFDARHPALLIGLYLVGSIALDPTMARTRCHAAMRLCSSRRCMTDAGAR
jgi:hypothetical protein